jgi:hypothetical protein
LKINESGVVKNNLYICNPHTILIQIMMQQNNSKSTTDGYQVQFFLIWQPLTIQKDSSITAIKWPGAAGAQKKKNQ